MSAHGPKADMPNLPSNVCFRAKSRHQKFGPQGLSLTDSGHQTGPLVVVQKPWQLQTLW
jgi:hypothetical protein